MAWQIEWEDRARRELLKLDKQIQREIISYLDERIAENADPRAFGKALVGNLAGLWRYRVRDYRIICQIDGDKLKILVVHIAHGGTCTTSNCPCKSDQDWMRMP